jgi:hypothetical protein
MATAVPLQVIPKPPNQLSVFFNQLNTIKIRKYSEPLGLKAN